MSAIAKNEDEALESTPPPLIDRLSLLPNELLDSIFELAYFDESPEAPLSKHLYPFFEHHLYRKVHLSSPSQVDLFLETITAYSERGQLVKSLEVDREREDVVQSLGVLEALFPLLPNLLHLEIGPDSIQVCSRSKNIFSSLWSIKSVSTTPQRDSEGFVNLDYFACLSFLPSLSHLIVYEWPTESGFIFEEEEAFHLSHVKTLQIQGIAADEDSIKVLVDLCPALLSVDLGTTYNGQAIYYDPALEVLPATLHSLRLRSEDASILPTDRLLLRFTQLHSLDLDKGCYSKTIHTVLSQLPLLVKVRLGQGTISPLDFFPLVSGPTRLVNLRQITLDFDVGRAGKRATYETYSTSARSQIMQEWKLSPDLAWAEDDDEAYVSKLKELIVTAEENGITIEGTVHQALANFEDFRINDYNRAVLDLKSSGGVRERVYLELVRDCITQIGLELPSLDLHSLDLTHLELVKIDLPERNWFIYSLRNEAGVSKEEIEMSEEEEFGTRTEDSRAKE